MLGASRLCRQAADSADQSSVEPDLARRWRSQGELRLDGRRPPGGGGLDGGNGAAEERKRDPLPPRSRVSRTERKLTEFLRTVWKQRVNVSHSGNLRSTDGSGERVERCRGLQDALEQACTCKGRGHKISFESSPNSLSFHRPKKWHDITGGQARELNSRRGVVAGEESRRVPLHFSTP